uniref:Oxysterol-binding protein n=1 Tax=Daucus carota subsp. sativus TaxID=79200 RepID=A0A164X7W4_DAUCS
MLNSNQLPPLFNIPKSQLQCYGELVYSNNNHLLSKCGASSISALERFVCVVAWSISAVRPLAFGVTPYNPILGETHHVSTANLNVLLEQVSHHPPVSALHATDQMQNIETIWCHYVIPTFHGTCIEGKVLGSKVLKLLNHSETYVMNSPNLVMRLFPVQGVECLGNVMIRCEETGLEANLMYKGSAVFGRRSSTHRAIQGRIYKSSSTKTLYEIAGHWDKTVTAKDPMSGKLRIIYNAKEAIGGLKTPVVRNPKGLWASESAVVWGEVNKGILSKSWDKAREAKCLIEEKERELVKLRASSAKPWRPKHFNLSYSNETGSWDCSPIQRWVPPAPIAVPP